MKCYLWGGSLRARALPQRVFPFLKVAVKKSWEPLAVVSNSSSPRAVSGRHGTYDDLSRFIPPTAFSSGLDHIILYQISFNKSAV